MPNPSISRSYWTGLFGAKIAPSNSSTIVALYAGAFDNSSPGGGVLISRNKGGSWTRITGITSAVPLANAAPDGIYGQKILFNPSDDSEFYIGIPNGGLWHCTSYGASCTRLDPGTIPASSTATRSDGLGHWGYYGMAWSGSTIIIGVYGTGQYISTNSGSTWAADTGGSPPTTLFTGGFASDGTYFGLNWQAQTGSNVYRRTTGGTWANIGPADSVWRNAIAVDPSNKDHVAIMGNGVNFVGTTNVSSNATGSATWQGNNAAFTIPNGDTPWMGWSYNGTFNNLNNSCCSFDSSGRLWAGMGIGIVYATSLPASGTATTWTPMTQGSEGLPVNWARWAPNGPALLASWDRPGWVITNPSVTQSRYAPNNLAAIRYSDAIDYSQDGNNFYVMAAGNLFYSSGGVGDWTQISGTNPITASCALAVFDANRWIVSDKSSGNVLVTANGGANWTTTPTGLTAGDFAWSGNNFHNLCYDGVTAGTAYTVNTGGTVFKTTNYGVSWSQVSTTGALSGFATLRLKSVVGKAGHLFFATGNPSTTASGQPTSTTTYLMFSNDGGATWTGVTNSGYLLTTAWDVATTPAAPGQSYPSVAVFGWMKTAATGGVYVLDVWRCDNFSGTTTMTGNIWTQMNWTLVGTPSCIEGNPSAYNQWILCNEGNDGALGCQYYGPSNVTW